MDWETNSHVIIFNFSDNGHNVVGLMVVKVMLLEVNSCINDYETYLYLLLIYSCLRNKKVCILPHYFS